MRSLDLGPLDGRVTVLGTPDEVDAFLDQHPDCVVFKVGSCHRTDDALAEIQGPLAERPELPVAFIDAVAARPASRHVAHRARVEHASPQVILFRQGEARYSRDNYKISGVSLREELSSLR